MVQKLKHESFIGVVNSFMHVKSLQSCLTPCDPTDCSPPGSSVHGIFQARILEWVACPLPGDLPDTEIKTVSLVSSALAGEFFTASATWEGRVVHSQH